MAAAYPTAPEVTAHLTALGITAVPALVSGIVAGMPALVDALTQRAPFLASSASSEYLWPVPGSNDGFRLFCRDVLKAGLVIEFINEYDDLTVVENSDYAILPMITGVSRNPASIIRFTRHFGDGKMRLTGLHGYSADVPDDLFFTLLNDAAESHQGLTTMAASGGREVAKIKQDTVEITYGSGSKSSAGGAMGTGPARQALVAICAGYRPL